MTGELTATGDIMTGALLGRAIEPHAGEQGGAGHGLCLNCGTGLIGSHCHACGQSGHVHRSVGAIGHELAHGVFHFEGKIWRTLPMLAFRPGQLTRRYIDGERARFVSPMALFLFSIFLLFAVVANLPGWHAKNNWVKVNGIEEGRRDLATALGQADAKIAKRAAQLAKARAEVNPDPEDIADIEADIAEARADRAAVKQAQAVLAMKGGGASARLTHDSWFETKYREAKANPDLLIYKLKSSAYKLSWALIPISLPFIWLLFPFRRDVGFYDHAVFATYSLSFMSLLVVALALAQALGVATAIIVFAALLVPPFHLYKQLKGTYGLGRLGGLWRLAWLLLFTTITSTLFVLLLLYLGLAE